MAIECRNCGTLLDAAENLPPEEKKPCPKCGSTVRAYYMDAGPGEYSITGYDATLEATGTVITATNLLLQTVVVAGDRTEEGQLIEAVTLPWLDIIEQLKNDPTVAYQIPPRKWEEIVAGAYKKAGFDEVTLTPSSGDLGRDVIAVKHGIGSVRVIDQVKAYKPNHLVTANDVRALMGVLLEDRAAKGFLTTTSDFAPKLRVDPLIVPLIPSRLELINGSMLLKRLVELAKKR